MKKPILLIASILMLGMNILNAQQPRPAQPQPGNDIMSGIDKENVRTSFILEVNPMDGKTKEKLNRVAANYRSRDRSVLSDLGNSMLTGGVTAVINVLGTEIINLTQIRSKQHKAWLEMRQKECTFIDSLQSVKGQSDFYSRQSNYGPLDPSDMNFDGITFSANRDGKEVLRMVCHIDTTRFEHLFLHSKFYLVVDSIAFYPYRSFLPNLKANRVEQPRPGASEDEIDYWNTISSFSFDEYHNPTVNIKMDLTSSWINELVQVYQDVKLGTFSVNIPVKEDELDDSVYIYSRKTALAEHLPTIDMEGDCFVVPRSYMPVSANNPSWGTGEYKMKVVLTENCRYNPKDGRAKNWHRDYKQLVKMQNNGKAKNEYWDDVVTTFRDNGNTILKATYTPVLNSIPSMLGIKGTSGAGMSRAGGIPSGAAAQGGTPAMGNVPGTGNKPDVSGPKNGKQP